MLDSTRQQWHPIAASHDLPFRHVFHAQLAGGIRLASRRRLRQRMGELLPASRCPAFDRVNDGHELKCQYHGWRYSNRTAGCTYSRASCRCSARTITATFPATERYGLVWSALEPEGVLAGLNDDRLCAAGHLCQCSAEQVVRRLNHRFQPSASLRPQTPSSVEASEFSMTLRAREGGAETLAVFFVQPIDPARCVIRGVLDTDGTENGQRLAVLRYLSSVSTTRYCRG